MEWFNRRDGIVTNVCGYTIWCFPENMTFSNNWVNCCLITLQLQVLHSFDNPFYVNEFPTKMNHVPYFFSSTKTNIKTLKWNFSHNLWNNMTLAYYTFLELTKFAESVGWKAFAWASFKFKHIGGRTLRPLPVTWRRCRGFPLDC